jgi:hydrogenase maturation protease
LSPRGDEAWEAELAKCLSSGSGRIHLVGVGNPIGRDDSVGIHVVSTLRRRHGARPRPDVWIHRTVLGQERTLSKLGGRKNSVVIFDAVECNREPGQLFCAKLSESRFGFFVTHNIPLKLIPGVAAGLENAWVVGIQPKDTGVGEEMTETVRHSAEVLIGSVGRLLEGGFDGPA